MREFNQDEKSLLADLAKSEAWRLLVAHNNDVIKELRRLATQPPGTASEENRTWYSALAAGREELVDDLNKFIE